MRFEFLYVWIWQINVVACSKRILELNYVDAFFAMIIILHALAFVGRAYVL